MVLHTIIDEYDVMRTDYLVASEQNTVTQNVSGGIVELIQDETGYRVNRLFSTNPAMYLNADYQPQSSFKRG